LKAFIFKDFFLHFLHRNNKKEGCIPRVYIKGEGKTILFFVIFSNPICFTFS
jgi:hypothetical protein